MDSREQVFAEEDFSCVPHGLILSRFLIFIPVILA
jgi:hypothetical protein